MWLRCAIEKRDWEVRKCDSDKCWSLKGVRSILFLFRSTPVYSSQYIFPSKKTVILAIICILVTAFCWYDRLQTKRYRTIRQTRIWDNIEWSEGIDFWRMTNIHLESVGKKISSQNLHIISTLNTQNRPINFPRLQRPFYARFTRLFLNHTTDTANVRICTSIRHLKKGANSS